MAGMMLMLAAAPARLGGGGDLDVSIVRIVSAMLLCLMLAVVAGLLLKRGGGRLGPAALRGWRPVGADRRIEVVESRRISPHADMCLVRCDGEDYLILCSQTTQRVLRRGVARVETA